MPVQNQDYENPKTCKRKQTGGIGENNRIQPWICSWYRLCPVFVPRFLSKALLPRRARGGDAGGLARSGPEFLGGPSGRLALFELAHRRS